MLVVTVALAKVRPYLLVSLKVVDVSIDAMPFAFHPLRLHDLFLAEQKMKGFGLIGYVEILC